MEKRVCIVNYNTPELTTAAVRSLLRETPDCKVTVFDNSDSRPFVPVDGVEVIDNTEGQYIDFIKFLAKYPSKMHTVNNWGSAKHSCTVDYLFSLYPDGFVLMDSDVLVKKDISIFFDDTVLFSGKVREAMPGKNDRVPRLLPFLCWINVPMCLVNGIRYFDDRRSWKLYHTPPSRWYDTGASFLEDCRKSGLPIKDIDINNFIIHLYGGSYKNKDWKVWLEENKNLW